MQASELPRGAVVWIASIVAAFGWFAIVSIDFVSNDFRSGICGGGLLELPQLCCVAPAWLAINGMTFASVMKSTGWGRKALACEATAIAATALAFAFQFGSPLPQCSAYM